MPSDRKMSTESTSRLSSIALATEDADRSPVRKAGSSFAASEVLSATAHRITAFASVTLNNSYGMCMPLLDSFCWNMLYYNILQPLEERPVTFVTLPQPIYFFSRSVT
jgi:hypothetical protein